MEFVKPIYLIVDRCPECERPHEFGPFCNDADTDEFIKSAKAEGSHLKNFRKELRAPLSDEQMSDVVAIACDGALKLFYEQRLGAAAAGLLQPNLIPFVFSIAQASMLQAFRDFRPGCTVEHMGAAMKMDGGTTADDIGKTVGGVQ